MHRRRHHASGVIVVCNNTSVSNGLRLHRRLGEENRRYNDGSGRPTPTLRNDDGEGGWSHRPNTILVDSQQLESGGVMSDDFKRVAVREIESFKAEYRERFPGRDAEDLADSDLLREVMNTVGKAGNWANTSAALSAYHVDGSWDANTVTHILGVRALERNCSASRWSACLGA